MICFLFYFTGTIYFINYTTLVGYETIKALAAENEIDTVYVRFADEDDDRIYDCMKPTHMHTLKKIISGRDPGVIGWRLHYHHREEKDLAYSKSLE